MVEEEKKYTKIIVIQEHFSFIVHDSEYVNILGAEKQSRRQLKETVKNFV